MTALVDRLERAGYARRVRDPDDRRRVLIEVSPTVHRLSAEIYATAEDAVTWTEAFSDDELELLHRFQELSKAWLEERLARVERLQPLKTRGRLRGRGRAS